MDKSLLNKAITPNEDPTPEWTRDFSTCQKVEEFLLKKLATDNPHVKRKVLIIIKNVAFQGDNQFALSLARKSEEIKKYTTYKGPIDPMHGDALNLQVRSAASQAIESVFKRTESKGTGGMGFMEGNNQGIQGTVGAKDPSVKDYTGFGANTATPQPSNNNNFGGFGTNNNNGFTPQVSQINSNSPTMGGGKYKGLGNPNFAQPTVANPNAQQTWTEWTAERASNVASYFVAKKPYDGTFDPAKQYDANWLNQENEKGSYSAPAIGNTKPGNTYFNPSDVNPQQGANTWDIQNASLTADNSGVHEAKIVDEFCTAVGVKVAPTRQELSQFVTRCASVNAAVLAEKLDDKLDAASWQVKLKALHAIEALLKAKNQEVVDFFSDNMENIQAQTVATQETLAQRAQKVIGILTKSDVPVSTAPAKKKPIAKPVMKNTPPVTSPEEELLFDLGGPSQQQQQQPPANKPAKQLTMDDMFNDMSISQQQQHTGVGTASDLDDILGSQPARKRTTSNSQSILNMIPSNTAPAPVMRTMPVVATPVMYTTVPTPYVQYIVAPAPVMRPMVGTPVAMQHKPMATGSGFDFMSNNQQKDGFDFIKTDIMGKK